MLPLLLIGSIAAIFMNGCSQGNSESEKPKALPPPTPPPNEKSEDHYAPATPPPPGRLSAREQMALMTKRFGSAGYDPCRTSKRSSELEYRSLIQSIEEAYGRGERRFAIYTPAQEDLELTEMVPRILQEKCPDAEFQVLPESLPNDAPAMGELHQGRRVYVYRSYSCS